LKSELDKILYAEVLRLQLPGAMTEKLRAILTVLIVLNETFVSLEEIARRSDLSHVGTLRKVISWLDARDLRLWGWKYYLIETNSENLNRLQPHLRPIVLQILDDH